MGGLVVATMLIIQFFPKLTKAVPSTLVAIVTIGIFNYLVSETKTVSDVLFEGTGSGVLSGSFPLPHLPTGIFWNADSIKIIFGTAFTVAMVGIIESLMTLQLIDDLTETRGSGNRECIAQGGANFSFRPFRRNGRVCHDRSKSYKHQVRWSRSYIRYHRSSIASVFYHGRWQRYRTDTRSRIGWGNVYGRLLVLSSGLRSRLSVVCSTLRY